MSSPEPRTPQSPSSALEAYCPSCDRSFDGEAVSCPNDGARLVKLGAKKDNFVGRDIDGRYRVLEKIGSGGMGTVYLGWQHSVAREVAIKVIDPRLAQHPDSTKRFLREARLASRLSHPTVVTVFDFGQSEDGVLYLVLERIKGRTLASKIREGALSLQSTLRIGMQLCEALDAAHRLNIVHRDLKPANIMLLDDPVQRDAIKVLDFGLAKSLSTSEGDSTVTRSGVILGTPRYMPPEAVIKGTTDARSDLYSLGVVLLELVTGKPAVSADSLSEIIALHTLGSPLIPDEVPADLRPVLKRLMERTPEDRYQSAREVHEALATISQTALVAQLAPEKAQRRVSGRMESPTTRALSRRASTTLSRGKRAAVVAALVAVSLGATGVFVLTKNSGRQNRPLAGAPQPVTMSTSPDLTGKGNPSGSTEEPERARPLPAPESIDKPIAAQVELEFRSTPETEVAIDGKEIGKTPIRQSFSSGSTPLHVTFSRKGYDPKRLNVIPNRSHLIEVTLKRTKRADTKGTSEPYPF
ncbi:MAG: serine/threonine protein kinase [Deltaproteobacteria bacterium]|nr:serine/threonine protein kinase [Deltaproteobacteria bacterium]